MGMINQPPHLPKKTCSVKLHNNVLTFKIFIFYLLISLFTGITGSIITFSWIFPNYNNSEFYLFKYNSNTDYNQNEQADNILLRRFQYNTVRIFDKSSKIYNDFYATDSFVGRAVLLSSNGWAVLYDPDFNYSKTKNWSVIDYKGIEHEIENTVYDSENYFVYLKLSGEEFHVVSFADVNNLDIGNKIWVAEKDTLGRSFVKERIVAESIPFWASDNYFLFKTDKINYKFNIVFDDQGKILGFLNEDATIKPIWKVEKDLASVLENSFIKQNDLDFKGYFVRQEQNLKIESDNTEMIKGFYVVQLKKYLFKNHVQVGDIILEINGREVNEDNLAYLIINMNESQTIKVWRNSEKIDIIR